MSTTPTPLSHRNMSQVLIDLGGEHLPAGTGGDSHKGCVLWSTRPPIILRWRFATTMAMCFVDNRYPSPRHTILTAAMCRRVIPPPCVTPAGSLAAMLLVRPSLVHVVVVNRDARRGAALATDLAAEHGSSGGVVFESLALEDVEGTTRALALADIVCTWCVRRHGRSLTFGHGIALCSCDLSPVVL